MADVTDRADGNERGATELILGALAGSALLPFIQAVAAKAGEDAYRLVRDKLSRAGRRNAEAEVREAGTITLAARDTRVVLQVPERITPAMAERLEDVRLPVHRVGWLNVAWHEQLGRWVVEEIAEPPTSTNTVDP